MIGNLNGQLMSPDDRLPIDLGWRRAFREYSRRLAVLALVVLANIALIGLIVVGQRLGWLVAAGATCLLLVPIVAYRIMQLRQRTESTRQLLEAYRTEALTHLYTSHSNAADIPADLQLQREVILEMHRLLYHDRKLLERQGYFFFHRKRDFLFDEELNFAQDSFWKRRFAVRAVVLSSLILLTPAILILFHEYAVFAVALSASVSIVAIQISMALSRSNRADPEEHGIRRSTYDLK